MKVLLLVVLLGLFVVGCVEPLPELNEPLPPDVAEMSRCIIAARRAWLDATGKELDSETTYAPGIAVIAVKLYEIRNEDNR